MLKLSEKSAFLNCKKDNDYDDLYNAAKTKSSIKIINLDNSTHYSIKTGSNASAAFEKKFYMHCIDNNH